FFVLVEKFKKKRLSHILSFCNNNNPCTLYETLSDVNPIRYRKQSFIYASNESFFYNKCVETLMGFVQKGL
ncbi:hypothetical protein BpHYR1_046128, partial [Brachionus plicatilis]